VTTEDLLRNVGLDRYDINARLKPALFVLLPLIITAAYWFPQTKTMFGATMSLLSACGLTYLLAQTARHLGRSVEKRMGDKAGRNHSARLLTHADATIAPETKARYHDYLRTNGRSISTPEEEKIQPDIAFSRARSAVDWLLEHTRPNAKKTLIFGENIAYGYRRNLYGMKPLGLLVAAAAIAGHGALLWLAPQHDDALWLGICLEAGLAAIFLLWCFVVTQSSVSDASLAYAEQLFNQCEPKKTVTPKRTRAVQKSPEQA
jgi:hypothetical protein